MNNTKTQTLKLRLPAFVIAALLVISGCALKPVQLVDYNEFNRQSENSPDTRMAYRQSVSEVRYV